MDLTFFDGNISLLNQALDLRSKRHESILSNLSNQDTPGYKAKNVNFKDALKSALSGEGVKKMDKTHPNHISIDSSVGGIVESIDSDKGAGLDGNNVDPEMEMAKMSENMLLYNASASILKKEFGMLKIAIKGR